MDKSETFKTIANVISTISIVLGIVISVMEFSRAKEKEAESRKKEVELSKIDAESRKIEAAKPFLELRQKLYLDALYNASILASKTQHTEAEVINATKRFAELYWGELSLIEEKSIEGGMMAIAKAENIDSFASPTRQSTYQLAHAMRESLIKSWGIDSVKIGNINR
ncbi:hypothetical protein SNE25_29215 [Mucilaginibacter sabulilitoris]|uniref:Uncharacterized protein n=1 Tax=Mucilaginibacter sabulilitoris TaxID=1173583 RepID=A0ABZ0TK32_9SPHI|nr:hypothetical protein [Mucilaginibacter sabulilitoris]WPU93403.1 hypothetical protein SNE25_29215 [Mucilaginibacter sabulilitoris]